MSGSGFTEAADLLPELNGADLAMSLSPKHQPHTTPFSVTDILSPIEESYRKLELCAPGSPYRGSGGSSGSSGPTAPSPHTPGGYMHVPQYYNGPSAADIPYSNSTAGWYPATPNDPRFASEYLHLKFISAVDKNYNLADCDFCFVISPPVL